MGIMTWSDALGVCVRQFDVQHKNLIDTLNALHDDMRVGIGKEVLDGVLFNRVT